MKSIVLPLIIAASSLTTGDTREYVDGAYGFRLSYPSEWVGKQTSDLDGVLCMQRIHIRRLSMTHVFDRIERMIQNETVVKVATKRMNAGEIWDLPVRLKKGEDYSLLACGGPGSRLRCSLFNGDDDSLAQSTDGRAVSVPVHPDEDGAYRVRIDALEGSSFPKVTVKVRKAYIPSRVRVWLADPLR